MSQEQNRNDLELSEILIDFHIRLVQFARHNHDELSPLAVEKIQKWLLDSKEVIPDAQQLTERGMSFSRTIS